MVSIHRYFARGLSISSLNTISVIYIQDYFCNIYWFFNFKFISAKRWAIKHRPFISLRFSVMALLYLLYSTHYPISVGLWGRHDTALHNSSKRISYVHPIVTYCALSGCRIKQHYSILVSAKWTNHLFGNDVQLPRCSNHQNFILRF